MDDTLLSFVIIPPNSAEGLGLASGPYYSTTLFHVSIGDKKFAHMNQAGACISVCSPRLHLHYHTAATGT